MSFSSYISGQTSETFTVPSIICSNLRLGEPSSAGWVLTDVAGNGVSSWVAPPVGAVPDFADFYTIVPGGGQATIAIGADVPFNVAGPAKVGTGITSLTATTFQLAAIGTYQVFFQGSFDEPGQLALTLAGAVVAYSVVGRATGTNQIVGMCLVTTVAINSVLTVRNNLSPAALTLTPLPGGTAAPSAHLVVTRLQ